MIKTESGSFITPEEQLKQKQEANRLAALERKVSLKKATDEYAKKQAIPESDPQTVNQPIAGFEETEDAPDDWETQF
ncbi:hypothetical protein ACMXYX_17720 (plasmid) [Neptuniibacter sp. QD72_48]|uniref:hypothetical protein n=1 Tax=Neptuniibacter sp. QD72_48 TaxID=3398214 RepID=UPI0039F528CA